jgi:uncharacterized protein (TIGR03067 family)
MRTFLPLAAVLLALAGAGSRADEKVAAPVPNAPTPPAIDGKYTLLATFGGAPVGKGKVDPTDPNGGWAGTARTTTRGEATITKNEITLEPRLSTGIPTTMEYTLDPTKTPMTIDVETISARGKRSKALGLVEVNGNRLTLALAREGAERPKTVDEAEGVTVYYFQKAPPPPRVEYRIVAMTPGKEEEAEKELNRLAAAGYELVNTTNPAAPDSKSSPTTVHFILKRTVRQ